MLSDPRAMYQFRPATLGEVTISGSGPGSATSPISWLPNQPWKERMGVPCTAAKAGFNDAGPGGRPATHLQKNHKGDPIRPQASVPLSPFMIP